MIRNLLPCAPKLAVAEIGQADYQQYGGLMLAPRSMRSRAVIQLAPVWAADNGAFTGFDAPAWLRMLDKLQGLPNCAFIVIPDALRDHARTLELYWQWEHEARERGFPRAFVLQNGVTLADVPLAHCEAVFVGCSNDWKYSPVVAQIAQHARAWGLWVHNGRVNTPAYVQRSIGMKCHSFDGTGFIREPATIRKILPYQQVYQQRMFEYVDLQ